jgi:hypothetical protein
MTTMTELRIQTLREWLAALDNAIDLGNGTYRPMIGDAKPMTLSQINSETQKTFNEIVEAGFEPRV